MVSWESRGVSEVRGLMMSGVKYNVGMEWLGARRGSNDVGMGVTGGQGPTDVAMEVAEGQ